MIQMTVLKSLDQKANKKFVVKNERIESEHRKFPFRFESDVHEFSDIYDMASGLPEIFEDSRKLAIHGLPVDQPTDRSRKGYNFVYIMLLVYSATVHQVGSGTLTAHFISLDSGVISSMY